MLIPMPEQASSWAARVDWINAVITWISVFCTVAITAVMLYFAIRYRRRGPNDKTSTTTHNPKLETVWTIIPTIVCIYMFWYGYDVYSEERNPPPNALEISVTAQKWQWTFQYPDGSIKRNELVVPLGRPVRLIMKSKDVTHSFYVPAMRVKEDVLGSIYTYLWFNPTKLGDFHIFCAEYCGTNHSQMLGTLKVVTPEAYDDFILSRKSDKMELPPLELGKKLYNEAGCKTCHSIDGSPLTGPTLKGVFGSKVPLEDGSTVDADENYLRESILNSKAKVVKGFPPIMPIQEGLLSDSEVTGLIAFIKSLAQ